MATKTINIYNKNEELKYTLEVSCRDCSDGPCVFKFMVGDSSFTDGNHSQGIKEVTRYYFKMPLLDKNIANFKTASPEALKDAIIIWHKGCTIREI